MKDYKTIKPLPFSKLDGISEKTISAHYEKLYQGYVKKTAEIQEKLNTCDKSSANATYSEIRELKLEESFALNAVLLHEAYFDILGGNGNTSGEIIEAISNNFGSFEKWQEEFRALGMSARGWVVMAYDFNDDKLRNYICDMHNQGGIWGAAPILVLDVYEHAYFSDYTTDRKSYIETFFKNLNWESINKKFIKIKK